LRVASSVRGTVQFMLYLEFRVIVYFIYLSFDDSSIQPARSIGWQARSVKAKPLTANPPVSQSPSLPVSQLWSCSVPRQCALVKRHSMYGVLLRRSPIYAAIRATVQNCHQTHPCLSLYFNSSTPLTSSSTHEGETKKPKHTPLLRAPHRAFSHCSKLDWI
jgi:hypothetical protein